MDWGWVSQKFSANQNTHPVFLAVSEASNKSYGQIRTLSLSNLWLLNYFLDPQHIDINLKNTQGRTILR